MPEDARRRVRAGRDLFEVRPADPASVHAHQHLVAPDRGNRHFLEAHVIETAIDRGLHGGRDRLRLSYRGRFGKSSWHFGYGFAFVNWTATFIRFKYGWPGANRVASFTWIT